MVINISFIYCEDDVLKFRYDSKDGYVWLMANSDFLKKKVLEKKEAIEYFYFDKLKQYEKKDKLGKYILLKVYVPNNITYYYIRVRSMHQQPQILGFMAKDRVDLQNIQEMENCIKIERAKKTKSGWENIGLKYYDLDKGF